jgi:ferredoxin
MLWLIVVPLLILVLCATAFWLIGERGHVMLPSTYRVFRERGVWSLIRPQTWHFYVYGCWPRQYIGTLVRFVFGLLAVLGERCRRWMANRYHGKVLTHEHARAIVTVDRTIPLRDLDRVIPYEAARHLLLQTPLDMAVYECPCRLTRSNPCRPTQVCMIVGQPFVDLVVEHHPHTSRRLTKEEALELLTAEHARGHVHVAWFKDVCLDRFFAICNCCGCCCGGIDAMIHHGIRMMTSSGYVATNDPARCSACGECETVCAFGAVHVNGHALVHRDRCMGCGVCVDRCRAEAMSLVRDQAKGIPLDVRQLT